MHSMEGLFAHRSVVYHRVAALAICIVPIYRLRSNLRMRIFFIVPTSSVRADLTTHHRGLIGWATFQRGRTHLDPATPLHPRGYDL
jgi:hypothetical protein